MTYRDINDGQTIVTTDENGDFVTQDATLLSNQDEEVHTAKVVGMATCDGENMGQALAGYDAKGDCLAAHEFPANTVLVLCEREL